MNLHGLLQRVDKSLKQNSPAILTGIGVSGVITTAYLTGKGATEATRRIDQEESVGGTAGTRRQKIEERVRLTWKLYIPAGISGALTIGCIVAGSRIGAKRTAAAYSLLTLSERAFTEYQEHVVEKIGENKERTIRDEIAQERVRDNPPVVIIGSGKVLCYEAHTDRYFNANMETLKRAQNEVNAQLLRENEANLNDFYHLVGLPHTSYSSCTGWTSDKLMELRISTVLEPETQVPCISFDYNYVKAL